MENAMKEIEIPHCLRPVLEEDPLEVEASVSTSTCTSIPASPVSHAKVVGRYTGINVTVSQVDLFRPIQRKYGVGRIAQIGGSTPRKSPHSECRATHERDNIEGRTAKEIGEVVTTVKVEADSCEAARARGQSADELKVTNTHKSSPRGGPAKSTVPKRGLLSSAKCGTPRPTQSSCLKPGGQDAQLDTTKRPIFKSLTDPNIDETPEKRHVHFSGVNSRERKALSTRKGHYSGSMTAREPHKEKEPLARSASAFETAHKSEDENEDDFSGTFEIYVLSFEEALYLLKRMSGTFILTSTDEETSTFDQWLVKFAHANPHGARSFLRRYVLYERLMSCGWRLRSGMKFGVDYLLYDEMDEPEKHKHAKYAIMVIDKKISDWESLLCPHRIASTTAKELILCSIVFPEKVDRDAFPPFSVLEKSCMRCWLAV